MFGAQLLSRVFFFFRTLIFPFKSYLEQQISLVFLKVTGSFSQENIFISNFQVWTTRVYISWKRGLTSSTCSQTLTQALFLKHIWVFVTPLDCSLPGSSLHGTPQATILECFVGCYFLLQGIVPTQESNPHLLHCRQSLYPLSDQGSPIQTSHTWTNYQTICVSCFFHSLFFCRDHNRPQMCPLNSKHRLQLILSDLEKKVSVNCREVQHKLCFALLPKPTPMGGSRFWQATSILLHLELNHKRMSCSLQHWLEIPQVEQWSAKNLEGHLPGDFLNIIWGEEDQTH